MESNPRAGRRNGDGATSFSRLQLLPADRPRPLIDYSTDRRANCRITANEICVRSLEALALAMAAGRPPWFTSSPNIGESMTKNSYWTKGSRIRRFDRLDRKLNVDVAVVGGGITGVTAAYLLKKAGCSVVLLERRRLGGVDTSCTTAHLTFVTDLRLSKLMQRFGRDHAQASWDAGRAAMYQIDEIVKSEDLACDFARVPGYLHAPWGNPPDHVKRLRQEAQLANELGFDAEFLDSIPGMETAGIRFPNQAKFHPLKYLAGMLERLPGRKCHVFDGSEVTGVEGQEKEVTVTTKSGSVTCEYLVVATHVPLQGKTGLLGAALFQSKLSIYTSYAIGVKLPRNALPTALFWDTSDPYQYLRVEDYPRHQYAIFGGKDHKTGQEEDTESRFQQLEDLFAAYVPNVEVKNRWSGQVVETNDGLPLIGEITERQFISTGYAGNGMTFGTLGAIMARDAALGRPNPWRRLFEVSRKKLIGGAWDYVKENVDYPYYMIRDRLIAAEAKSLGSLKRGEGGVLQCDGRRVAAYRDPRGRIKTVSPICTHLGCIVHWNAAESTLDCPCHGSRFEPTGRVIAGPAESPLESIDLNSEKRA
jgi:glycine/D-amino acid oxidase-like deaminating enzyme/nitrite reductase/ring-hydroxylating ferredoxin subunit